MVFTSIKNKIISVVIITVILIVFLEQTTHISYNDMEKSSDILLVDNLSHIGVEFEKELETMCLENNYNLIVKKDACVNYFKNLNGSYSLIILRLHSTNQYNVTWLFTSEEYGPNRYYLEQLAGEIQEAGVDYLSGTYFVLSSYYFKHYLIGNIKADCVILMGCNGLASEDMAQAWIDAGASSYVGWCGDISINMTDVYTKDLVQSYIKKGLKQGILDHLPSKELKEEDPAFVVYVGIQ